MLRDDPLDKDKRHQLFRDLAKYSQSVGVFVAGFVGYLLNLKFEKNTAELDFYIPIVAVIAVVLIGFAPILLILGAKEPKKS